MRGALPRGRQLRRCSPRPLAPDRPPPRPGRRRRGCRPSSLPSILTPSLSCGPERRRFRSSGRNEKSSCSSRRRRRGRRVPDGPWLLGLTAREFFDASCSSSSRRPGWSKGRISGSDATEGATRGCWPRGVPRRARVRDRRADGHRRAARLLVEDPRVASRTDETDEAARLLGRPHRIRGLVTHGAARGAGLGFPTANLDEIDTLIPDDGVYAGTRLRRGPRRRLARGLPRRAQRHVSASRSARSRLT